MIEWMKNGKPHRNDIDLEIGLTLPAIITDKSKSWKQDGVIYRNDVDQETGINLPSYIYECNISSNFNDKKNIIFGTKMKKNIGTRLILKLEQYILL